MKCRGCHGPGSRKMENHIFDEIRAKMSERSVTKFVVKVSDDDASG